VTIPFWTLVAMLVAWAAIAAWRRRREDAPTHQRTDAPTRNRDDDIDREELERAEREVRGLDTDARGRPLDEGVGDDWGPGTPKPPYI